MNANHAAIALTAVAMGVTTTSKIRRRRAYRIERERIHEHNQAIFRKEMLAMKASSLAFELVCDKIEKGEVKPGDNLVRIFAEERAFQSLALRAQD